MNIEGIVLVRIDDRLIHGQVMTSWLNYTGANKIMIPKCCRAMNI